MRKANFTTNIHLCCGRDDLRPVFKYIHFINGFAYATNGHIMIRQSLKYHDVIDPDLLNGKSIHKNSYVNIKKYEIATATETGILCQTDDMRVNYEYAIIRNNIPNFDKIFDQFENKKINEIGIHPKFIEIASKILFYGYSEQKMKISFAGTDKGMIITVPNYEDQQIILMPMQLHKP